MEINDIENNNKKATEKNQQNQKLFKKINKSNSPQPVPPIRKLAQAS